ncbi:LysM peptidoglycan-binding domain-containing protein [Streptomyces sp. RLB3-17]|uniref:LysM peptidoglycan-binding domain-containing protein n=1 Tax=Streptomyces sp. RLB3-17 TaxID=2594455 RepID=UPI001164C52E|nr:LysM peptidoglycan-binding domain-containing protein [Streptomyces sp. RLB3-17]QDO45816.1 LysM peptidoglycan-binding domain-containing protein [Streptomyces sp. RLB3-17]
MAHRTPAPLRTVGALVRALLGLALLVALLAGTPYVLLLVGTQPTDLSGGIDVLLRPDDGTLFFTAITCIGWVAWAAFTLSVVLEIVAVTRRRSAPRLRGLGGLQSMASFLVGGIVLLAPTAASAATSAPAHAVTATQATGDSTPSATFFASPSAEGTNGPTHTVSSSTELPWDLAEKYLGSGQRWQDIAALNPDIPGLAAGDQYLPKGAVIALPSDAVPAAPAVSPASAQAGGARTQLNRSAPDAGGERGATVTVQPGDYLSEIAQKELGDGAKWPKLFEASRGKPQPHGLPEITNPDVIYPGQQVTVPGARDERHEKPAEGESGDTSSSRPHTPSSTNAPHSGQKPGDDHANTQDPAPRQSTAPAPQTSSPSKQSSRPTHQPGQEQGAGPAAPRPSASTSATASAEPSASDAPSPTATATQEPASSPASGTLQLRTVLGAGALLAAAVTGALALRRLLQRSRRKPGETIAIASEISPAEAQLAAAAEPGGAARLDVALRTLAHQAAQDGDGELPQLRAARIGARALEVLPEDLAHEPRAPFAAGKNGWWVLPPDAPLLEEEAAREVPAPYPALVTIGSTEAGDLLLLNLAQVPALLLEGNPARITEVCTSLALELAMSPWAAEVEVVTVGFGQDLPQLLPTARIAHMRQAAHALRDLSERLLEAHQMPETQHQPYLLLCASALDADLAWKFADVIDKAGPVPVTLVAPASTAAAHFHEAEILNASLGEPQQLDYTGTQITLQRLEHAAYLQITTALKVSGQPSHPAEGPWGEVPDEPDTAQHPTPRGMDEPARRDAGQETHPVPAITVDAGEGVFPALLAASADPTGLRLLPAAQTPGEPHGEPGKAPDTTATDAAAAKTSASQTTAEPAATKYAGHESEAGAQDLHAPEIRVLGQVEVTGVAHTGHGPRQAQLAALMYFRPGRSADALCADMDPLAPWSASTLNARVQGLRRALGSDPSGKAYVPRRRAGDDPYKLSESVRCDWTRFLQLTEHALPRGPAGLPKLEQALGLVRGRPFGTRPLPWAQPYQQEMITRIIDVAHSVAVYRTPAGPHHDLNKGRQAIATGLEADDSAELLYRDWMRIESAAGNRQGLHTAITRVQQINRALDCSLEIETEQLIHDLLSATDRQAPAQ